jgi:hypothetical protein
MSKKTLARYAAATYILQQPVPLGSPQPSFFIHGSHKPNLFEACLGIRIPFYKPCTHDILETPPTGDVDSMESSFVVGPAIYAV